MLSILEHKKFGIDADESAILYVSKYYKNDNIKYLVSDVYSALNNKEKFDILISNLPQLPSESGGKIHDVSGHDGLNVIRDIISGFKNYTHKDSVLYLLIFDFLLEKIRPLCLQTGLQCNIFAYYNKTIRKGGETEKRIKYIETIYPTYVFTKNKENFTHFVFILEIKNL